MLKEVVDLSLSAWVVSKSPLGSSVLYLVDSCIYIEVVPPLSLSTAYKISVKLSVHVELKSTIGGSYRNFLREQIYPLGARYNIEP